MALGGGGICQPRICTPYRVCEPPASQSVKRVATPSTPAQFVWERSQATAVGELAAKAAAPLAACEMSWRPLKTCGSASVAALSGADVSSTPTQRAPLYRAPPCVVSDSVVPGATATQ